MYKKLKGPNGLNVVVSPMPQMASVSLSIWIGVGGRYENAETSGISHLIEHMLFKGTHARTARDLKESIEGIGGAFNGFTSDEATCYMVKVPAKYVELGVDVLSDMVLNPRFDSEDILREKFVVCEEIKMYKDQPSDHVLDILAGIMWPGHALGRTLTGDIATVKGFTRDDLTKFKENSYHPSNIAVIAAGKVVPEKLLKYVTQRFQGQKRKKNTAFNPPKTEQKRTRMKVCYGKTNQTHIAMGFHVAGFSIRERFAIKLLNIMLGGNMSSRLFEELREKSGLCYDISSSYKSHSDVGEMQIHAGVDSKKAYQSVIAILDELKKLTDSGVSPDEFKRAKEYAKGQFLLAMESTASRMVWLGDRLIVHKNIPQVKDILKHLDNVELSEIQKVAKKIFKGSLVNLAMIGKLGADTKTKIKRELNRL